MRKLLPIFVVVLTAQVAQAEDDVPQTLLDLHNQVRQRAGCVSLKIDERLNRYAQSWARVMAQRSNLRHSNISGIFQLGFRGAAENIAHNQRTPHEVVRSWMQSPGHRSNILSRSHRYVGFGVAYNNRGEPYWCTVFGH